MYTDSINTLLTDTKQATISENDWRLPADMHFSHHLFEKVTLNEAVMLSLSLCYFFIIRNYL